MKAQGIISDVVLNVRRGKQHFTYHELQGMTAESNPGMEWYEFDYALKLVVCTGEVKSTVEIGPRFVDAAIFTPGSAL